MKIQNALNICEIVLRIGTCKTRPVNVLLPIHTNQLLAQQNLYGRRGKFPLEKLENEAANVMISVKFWR